MADKVTDEFLVSEVELLSSHGPNTHSHQLAEALRELLQRRKDGMSPEDFVLSMAKRAAEVSPAERSHFLHALGEIQRHVWLVRGHVARLEGPTTPEARKRAQEWLERQERPTGAAQELISKTAEVLQLRAKGQASAEHE